MCVRYYAFVSIEFNFVRRNNCPQCFQLVVKVLEVVVVVVVENGTYDVSELFYANCVLFMRTKISMCISISKALLFSRFWQSLAF